MKHIVAFYEIDRCYGGAEEGGWWYDAGTLVRFHCVVPSEAAAFDLAARARANRLLELVQRGRRSLDSVLYAGGRYRACVFAGLAPPYFPETPPHYE